MPTATQKHYRVNGDPGLPSRMVCYGHLRAPQGKPPFLHHLTTDRRSTGLYDARPGIWLAEFALAAAVPEEGVLGSPGSSDGTAPGAVYFGYWTRDTGRLSIIQYGRVLFDICFTDVPERVAAGRGDVIVRMTLLDTRPESGSDLSAG